MIIPTLFPYFLPFWYPYILLHFKCFLLLCKLGFISKLPTFLLSVRQLSATMLHLEQEILVVIVCLATSLTSSLWMDRLCNKKLWRSLGTRERVAYCTVCNKKLGRSLGMRLILEHFTGSVLGLWLQNLNQGVLLAKPYS